MPGLVGRFCLCVRTYPLVWGFSTRQNDIPAFVSTFLRRLHSFCVTAAAAGEARGCWGAGGGCRCGVHGRAWALNRPTKGKKMVQCHGNYSWMSFEWHDMSQAFLSGSGVSTSSLEESNWTAAPLCTQAPESQYIVILMNVQCLMNPQTNEVTEALCLP